MTAPVASLAMYDHPAQHWANAALWDAIAARLWAEGIAAPRVLDPRPAEAAWRDPALLLAQCCGYPLVADPTLALRVVARPRYLVPGCEGGGHHSRIVVRATDRATTLAAFRGRVAAVNAPLSNTGANLLHAAVAPHALGGRFFAALVETGSHRASIDAVREGEADLAAIDAVSYAAIERYEPAALAGLRTLARTRPSPTLPFVTARTTPAATVVALRRALTAAAGDPALGRVRAALFLDAIESASIHRYVALRTIGGHRVRGNANASV